MLPEIVLNYSAIIVCVIIAMPLGFLWYGPIFGNAWAHQMGFDPDEKPGGWPSPSFSMHWARC